MTLSYHEIPMAWSESITDVLAGFPQYTTDDVKQVEVCDDGLVLIMNAKDVTQHSK